MEKKLRIGMVAGEASGDILGAGLIRSLKQHCPNIEFEGIGGPLMIQEGFHSHYSQERLAVMGYVEPLKRLPELLRIRKQLREHFLTYKPDLFIGIDSPDFNLSLEEALKSGGIVTAHYVSPSVWAWKQKRIFKIARSVDLMLTLFPFEADFYRQHQVPVRFVGHPLADDLPLEPSVQKARQKLNIAKSDRLVALLPGSRGAEVKLLGPVFLATAAWCLERYPDLKFIVPAANEQRMSQLQQQLASFPELPVELIQGNSHTVMEAADVVLMASGTTTLEALLLKKPMVVAYKMGFLSYAIISRMVKSEFISLPNLLAGQELVPEILQNDAVAENLGPALLRYFEDKGHLDALNQAYLDIHRQLKCDASANAAAALLELIETNTKTEFKSNGTV